LQPSVEDRIADTFDAAVAYVRAREAAEGSDAAGQMAAVATVDRCYADLVMLVTRGDR
jgi:hypothetical protein